MKTNSSLVGAAILSGLIFIMARGGAAKKESSQNSEFRPVDIAPVLINNFEPVYPQDAFEEGITGTVWVKALVNKSGVVTDAIIAKDSGKNAGFEKSALDAARLTKWKPAMSEGEPIAVWVTYKVDFGIKSEYK